MKPRILLVEDDAAIVDVFQTLLAELAGFEVTVSEDVAEGLSLARASQVDLVIMDVLLSNSALDGQPVDGVTYTRLLKGDPATAHIPVLLWTAHAMPGDEARLRDQSGADDYLAKPLPDVNVLIDRIKALLAGRPEPEARHD